ncbi:MULTISPECIES: cupin domain-containing protein [unclassified Polynucleobacter]|uniref:cupin domain-containing protein n=1 Tax=unclassified Polynucleobacter TaxID=2640945 RepID=UPI002572FED8|nr:MULTISPECIES: cupin domain-containing protein [unclassified Polynucleobacter]
MTKTRARYEPPKAPATLPLDRPWPLLGNLSPQTFMQRYWHKCPLLVRQAIPAFALSKEAGLPLLSPIPDKTLFGYACDGLSEARLVEAKPWRLQHGPFRKKEIPSSSARDWTLLIQGMEARHPTAAHVLSWFRFIPDARLDDLMISIAGIGGGVGPHVDSYDVFLIQMEGRRRWRISGQTDLSLRPDLPLKILARFKPEQEWVLEPGDLLYLPPNIAHEGVALDAGCQTWSVGFRSPSYRELISEGLWRLAESLESDPSLGAIYADPKQKASSDPARLPAQLEDEIRQHIAALDLNQSPVLINGITAYLSEPKPQAIFTSPDPVLSPSALRAGLQKMALVPHPQTRLLIRGETVFCNGDAVTDGQDLATIKAWQILAQQHFLTQGRIQKSSKNKGLSRANSKKIDRELSLPSLTKNNSLYEAYSDGWLLLE